METITSHTIKMDMNSSLEKLLKEVGIVQNSETRIQDYEKQIAYFVSENDRLIKKAKALEEFGFLNTPTSKNLDLIHREIETIEEKIHEIKRAVNNKKALEETIAKYSLEFPSFKFIPTETMVEVMRKYDLILGETCMYSKEIPNIALDILAGFSNKIKQQKYLIDARFAGGNLTFFSVRPSESVIGVEKPYNYIKSNLKIIAPESHFDNKLIETNGVKIPTFIVNEETRSFEVNLVKLNDVVRSNTEVLDPILCLEVDEGYIIFHAWDEEAKIPEIKNTLLN